MVTGYRITVVGIKQYFEENYKQALLRYHDIIDNTNKTCSIEQLTYNVNGSILKSKEVLRGGTDLVSGKKWEYQFKE